MIPNKQTMIRLLGAGRGRHRVFACSFALHLRGACARCAARPCAFCRTRAHCRLPRRRPRRRDAGRWRSGDAASAVRCDQPAATCRPPPPSGRRRAAARRPNSRISIVRCCTPRGVLRAASRSPSSPSARRRRPAPARVRRRASYPSRLAVELKQRFPGHDITVLNRGVNGEETDDMMARFDTGVIAEHPQLVLWQVGTNSVLRDHPLEPHAVQLHEGIEELKATGADVVLIDPQYSPTVIAKSGNAGHGRADRARGQGRERRSVPPLRGHARLARGPASAFDAFVSPDGLHMNDWSYACVAKLLGRGDHRSRDPPGRLGGGASAR